MSQRFFNNRRVVEPGVYTRSISGIKPIPQNLDFGRLLVIDTGSNTGWGGAGINGAKVSGEDSLKTFDNITDFRNFIGGGLWFDLAEYLFRPNGFGTPGISSITWASASTTVAATETLSFNNVATDDLTISARLEGTRGNGAETSNVLHKGFAITLEAGTVDATKFVFKFWEGAWNGEFSTGVDLDGIAKGTQDPILIAQSVEVANLTEFISWATTDINFQEYFEVDTPTASGVIEAADLTGLAGNNLFSGGSTTYNSADLDTVLDTIGDLNYNFLLSDKFNANAAGADNVKILAHLTTEAVGRKFLVIGGSDNKTNFVAQSLTPASTLNSSQAIIVHGGFKRASVANNGLQREYSSLYMAAAVLGRTAGLEPQTPLTFKALDIDGLVHTMNRSERERALDGGVLHVKYDRDIEGFIVNEGINTLQLNRQLVQANGDSYLIQVERVNSQLLQEIRVNAKIDLLGNQSLGPNRNTLSVENVKEWLSGYLTRRTATDVLDNLILSFSDISVSVIGNAYDISFNYVPNFEVNQLFFTGRILDPNFN